MTVQDHAVASIALECSARPGNVAHLRRRAAAFAGANGADPDLVYAVRTAVGEAVGNVVRHAYPAGPGSVALEMDVEGGELEVVVADEGIGFAAPDPSEGIGLALMRGSCAELDVRDRPTGGVEVWMRFPVAG